jgi:polyribonucleotide nucleotidyltransferase
MDMDQPQAETQAETGIPTYDEAFPSLPELDETRKSVAQAQRATWATSAIRPTQTTQVFTIAYEELKDPEPLGKKQSIFKTIADETNTTITRSVSKDKSVTITIAGKVTNVNEARKRLVSSLQTQVTLEVAIPKELHRFIVGKEGKVLKDIEASTATTIKVPSNDNPKQTISVSGTIENARKASAEIQLIADEKAKLDTVRLPIKRDFHALIAGHNNSNIKQITDATGARIYLPPPNAEKTDIVVSGEKPGVHEAVRQVNAIYESLRKTCGQTSVAVKKSQHRYVIGPKGSAIAEVMQKTGVAVEVPAQDNASELITLRGPQANLQAALELVKERASSHTNEIISIPGWLHKIVLGRGGANIKVWQQQSPNVRVDFNKESDEISLDGPPDEVYVLRAALLAFAGELEKSMTHEDKKVDPKHHPHLIGKGGSVITQIRDDTGAEISLLPKEKPEFVRIVGSAEAVKKALAAINEIVSKQENMRSVDIIVPQRYHAALIGAQGSTIKSITELFPTASINMPKGDSEIVVVRGDKKDVDGAEKHIRKLLKQFEEDGFQLEFPVFKEFHRQIIGRSGSNIKQISDEFSVRIKFPGEDSDSNMIVVTGKKKNAESARERILAIQGQLASVVTEELNIDARFHSAIIGPKGRVVAAIMHECGGVQIHFPHGTDKGTKPNLVVIKGPKDDVKKAKARLEELATAELLSHHTEEVHVKREFHRYLIGRQGAERAKLQDALGVRLFFPRPTELSANPEDDVVTIVGKKEACQAAKAKLLERVKQLENTIEGSVNVDSAFYKDFTANRGRFLKELAEEFGGVSVTLPRPDAEGKYASDVVQLKGSKEDVPRAIERIKQFVEEVKNRVTLECQIPAFSIPAVMGPGGSNVNRLCQEFNVVGTLPERTRHESNDADKPAAAAAAAPAAPAEGQEAGEAVEPETKMETVYVSGSKDNCEKAIVALMALVPIKETVEVDSKYFSAIIGEKGAKVAQLSQETNCKINIPKKGSTVTLRGLPAAVAHAKERLAVIVADLELRSFSATIDIDPKHHPVIIGSKGASIREFRKTHDVDIEIPKDNAENPNAIRLVGYQNKVEAAMEALREKVAELESMVTLELSIDPRVHARLVGPRGASVRALQEKHNVRIVFPREKESWQILVIGPEDGAEEAKSALELQADDFMQDILDREHMQQFVKDTTHSRESSTGQHAAQAAFQVRNAPWQGGAQSDFPALGAARQVPTAWVRK